MIKQNTKKNNIPKRLTVILSPIIFLVLNVIGQPLLAIETSPCKTFNLRDFSEQSLQNTRVINNLKPDLGFKSLDNGELTKVEVCTLGIRNYTKEELDLMTLIACTLYEQASFEQASILFNELLLFAEQTNSSHALLLAHNHLGLIATINNFKLSAYFHYQKLMEYAEQHDNNEFRIAAHLNLGSFDYSNRAYENAEKHYKNCLRFLEIEPDANIKNWVVHRLGELKLAQNNKKEAFQYLTQAIQYWEETGQYKGACFSNLLLSFVYKDEHPKQEEAYLLKALEAGNNTEYTFCKVEIQLNLGLFYIRQKAYKKALEYLEEILAHQELKEMIPRVIKAHQLMAKVYLELGMVAEANKSHEAYLRGNSKYEDNFLASNSESIENVERLILQKKEYELVKKENEYAQGRLFFQKILTLTSILALFFAIMTAITFFRKNRKNRTQKERLAILNEQNSQQAKALTKARIITENQKKDLEVEMVKKALILSQQGEVIQSIANKLENMERNEDTLAMRKEVTKVKNNSLWTELNLQITQSNEIFFEKLLERYPNLTQSDLRLCAFLKMNMNTKEIANLTFKNPESIKVARSRLRKKLNLTHSKLTFKAFFIQIMKANTEKSPDISSI